LIAAVVFAFAFSFAVVVAIAVVACSYSVKQQDVSAVYQLSTLPLH